MPPQLSKRARTVSWIAQIVGVVILGQTLFFKLTGAPEAVAMFTTLGVEPWGRILTGTAELATVLLLLRSTTAFWGGLLGVGLMFGAIGAHLTKLGIVVANDGGLLFGMAMTVLAASATIVYIRRGAIRPILLGTTSAVVNRQPDVTPGNA